MPGGWRGSDRAQRLPPDWPARRAAAARRNPSRTCHLCGQPGGDYLDHIIPGDDHSPGNLDWAHDAVPPHCHRYKSAREGVEARQNIAAQRYRPREQHPGLIG